MARSSERSSALVLPENPASLVAGTLVEPELGPDAPGAYLALDAGGSTISAGVIAALSGASVGPIEVVNYPERASARELVETLSTLLRRQRQRALQWGLRPLAAGVAIPGPFEYKLGVGRRTIGKYSVLNGVELITPLQRAVSVPVLMCNDASAYALGSWRSEHSEISRFVGVVLSTGSAALFLENGQEASPRSGAPLNAGVDCFSVSVQGETHVREWAPGSTLDWFHPRRGLEEAWKLRHGEDLSVSELAREGRGGNPDAVALWEEFGECWGQVLSALTAAFEPEMVTFGGQISRAFDLFGPSMERAWAASGAPEARLVEGSGVHLALVGAAQHALNLVEVRTQRPVNAGLLHAALLEQRALGAGEA